MTGRKADKTGRSTGLPASSKVRGANRPPAGENFIWITRRMVESPAYRAMSGGAHKILGRIALEHMMHAGTRNGELIVTYNDFQRYGIRRPSVRPFLAEAIVLGFVHRTVEGRTSYGDIEGAAAQYRLTWLPTKDGAKATNEWSRYTSVEEATAAVAAARATITVDRAEKNAKRPRTAEHLRRPRALAVAAE